MRPGGADDGSGSVYVLTASLVLLAMALGAATVGEAVVLRHRAEAAADLVALAGAAALGRGGDGCGTARRDAASRGAVVESCAAAADGSVTVVLRLASPPLLARLGAGPARARAKAR